MKKIILIYSVFFTITMMNSCINEIVEFEEVTTQLKISEELNSWMDIVTNSDSFSEINLLENQSRNGHYLTQQQLDQFKSELGLTNNNYNFVTLDFIDEQVDLAIGSLPVQTNRTRLLNSGFTPENVDLAMQIISNPDIDLWSIIESLDLSDTEISHLELTRDIVKNVQFPDTSFGRGLCGISHGGNSATGPCSTILAIGGAVGGFHGGNAICGLPCGVAGAAIGGLVGWIVGSIADSK